MPDLFVVTGACPLTGAMSLIPRTDRFPGWWVLLPTSAPCLILAVGMRAWIDRALLAQPLQRPAVPVVLAVLPRLLSPVRLRCNARGCESTVARAGVLHPAAQVEARFTSEGSTRLVKAMPGSPRSPPDARR